MRDCQHNKKGVCELSDNYECEGCAFYKFFDCDECEHQGVGSTCKRGNTGLCSEDFAPKQGPLPTVKYHPSLVCDRDTAEECVHYTTPTEYGGDLSPKASEDILTEALRITSADRQNQYGPPEDNFQRIADHWHTYLLHRGIIPEGSVHKSLIPKDVAMMMALMKIAREGFAHKRDNLVDACGYLRCASKIEGDEA